MIIRMDFNSSDPNGQKFNHGEEHQWGHGTNDQQWSVTRNNSVKMTTLQKEIKWLWCDDIDGKIWGNGSSQLQRLMDMAECMMRRRSALIIILCMTKFTGEQFDRTLYDLVLIHDLYLNHRVAVTSTVQLDQSVSSVLAAGALCPPPELLLHAVGGVLLCSDCQYSAENSMFVGFCLVVPSCNGLQSTTAAGTHAVSLYQISALRAPYTTAMCGLLFWATRVKL